MFEHLRAHLARPTFFVAAGIAIGALLAPTFDGGGAQALTTYTRTASCGALGGFQPINSATEYAYQNTTKLWWKGGGSGFFLCNPGLPNKAVVTKVRFTIIDYSIGGEVRNCALVRSGLTPTTAESFQVLASVPATGVSNYNDQPIRPSDTSISYATIDNANFAYWLQCELSESNAYVALYGADVTYKITAANG
jgi:hypothetical protein